MVFNDTSTKLGLLQDCEVKLFGDNGYGQITSNTNRLYQFTARINRSQDNFIRLAITSDGRWQYDDDNNTNSSVAVANIVSGQQDYTLNSEQLEIEKVLIKDPSGLWVVITPIDQDDSNFYLQNNTGNTGTPSRYDKRGNQILLDCVPNYNSTGGLKIYFKRGANYFVYTDTTKVPGFASHLHGYLSTDSSLSYAIDRGMTTQITALTPKVQEFENAILEFYSKRSRDEATKLKAIIRSSR